MPSIALLAIAILTSTTAVGEGPTIVPDHPRLLIRRAGLPGLRTRCGVMAYREMPEPGARFASEAAAFNRVRRAADRVVDLGAAPGELYLPALAHLVLGEIGQRDRYVERVEIELREAIRQGWHRDDVIFALDWCWDALSE
ncbi:MAG: hypothetical protein JXA69_05850, partial [Phycisphaerae bacterium]|nr:hypothetical protein [Phycisphaerae bacterium]